MGYAQPVLPIHDRSFWQPGLKDARESALIAREAFVFLHLAKSGGTTFLRSMIESPLWRSMEFPYPPSQFSSVRRARLWTRAKSEPWLGSVQDVRRSITSRTGFFVWGGHATFDHVSWLAHEILPRDSRTRVVTTFRPMRERAVSRFRDYWAQAALGALPRRQLIAEVKPAPWESRDVFLSDREAFYRDSQNYRDASGKIDGNRWFRDVFMNPGFPFLSRDVFGSVETLETALSSGVLRAIPLKKLDSELVALTGARPSRARVSPAVPDDVAQALEKPGEFLQKMIDADAAYDAVFERYTSSR